MRTFTLIAGAALLAPAFAAPNHSFARKAKSPVPVSVGFGKAIAFKLNKDNDLVGGIVAEDDGHANSAAPYVAVSVWPEGGHDKEDASKPPFWGGKGSCCKPTEQCHAYVKWMLDMQNGDKWESDAQRREANSHVECCLRQYRASCDSSLAGNTIVWRDPSKFCSPGKGSDVPTIPETAAEAKHE